VSFRRQRSRLARIATAATNYKVTYLRRRSDLYGTHQY
jgi:hypothetical protein